MGKRESFWFVSLVSQLRRLRERMLGQIVPENDLEDGIQDDGEVDGKDGELSSGVRFGDF